MSPDPKSFLLRASQIKAKERPFSHPWNPNSAVSTAFLGEHSACVEPESTSLAFRRGRSHSCLTPTSERKSGSTFTLAAASLKSMESNTRLAQAISWRFPLRRSFITCATRSQKMVYLMGGENLDFEIEDFPSVGKRMVRRGTEVEIYNNTDAKPFGPLEV